MFEQIFQTRRLIERHRQAPLRAEREQYLRHLVEQGFCHSKLSGAATYMIHIIRVLGLHELRVVDEEEIEKGANFWAGHRGHSGFSSP